jgi:hypothetical protein
MQGPRLDRSLQFLPTSYSNLTATTSGDQNMRLMSNSSAASNAEIKSTLMLISISTITLLPLLMKLHALHMIRGRDDEVRGGNGACMTRAVARTIRHIV